MCMHAESLVQQQRRGFALTITSTSRFKLKDKCRSEKWELYLYGDLTIKVDLDSVEVLPWVPPPRFFTQLGNRPHSFYELCLPSERGMGMSMPLAVPVLSGSTAGCACPRLPVAHAAMSFTVTLARSTIGTTAVVVSTRSASADCTDSTTPLCSSGACVVMSCDCGSFTPNGAVHGVMG